jgi:outer membrane receptor protein involved in Fe transport
MTFISPPRIGFLRLVLLTVAVVVFSSGPLWAQSKVEELVDLMSLEQLMSLEVHSTSFFDTPIEKSPGSLYIITEEMLDFSYAQSLADYLAYYVPGAHISQFSDSGALYSTRGFSGGTNVTTQFMLDSESLNSSSGATSNLNLPLLGYIDRVEVLNGPCSLLHGSGSVNGFVNIIPKNGTDNPGAFASTEVGLQDGLVRLETGNGSSDLAAGDLYVYFGGVKSDALETPADSADAFTEPSFRALVNWRRDQASLLAFIEQQTYESGLNESYVNTDEGYPVVEMGTYSLRPKVQFDLTDTEDVTFSLPVKYFEQSKVYADTEEYYEVGEFQLAGNVLFRSTRVVDHRIAVGGSATYYHREKDSLQADVFDYFSDSDGDDTEDDLVDLSLDLSWVVLSAFMEDNVQLSPRLSLFAGVRYDTVHARDFKLGIGDDAEIDIDYEGAYEEEMTPRIGLTYELAPSKILKLMYQQGYSYPDYSGRISSNSIGDTSSERVQSYELGYHQSLERFDGEFSLNAYYNLYTDMSVQALDEDGVEVYMPVVFDSLAAAGFEVSLALHPLKSTRVDASYAFSRPYDVSGDLESILTGDDVDEWIIYPTHTLKLNLTRSLLGDRLDLILGFLYNNSITTLGGDSSSSDQEDVFDSDRFVVNAAARYRLDENLTLTLRGTNILDNDVPATGYYYYLGYESDNSSYMEPKGYIGLDWTF